MRKIDFIFLAFIQLPKNDALQGLCEGMVEAWNLQNKKNSAILFVIEDVTFNICDQVWRPHGTIPNTHLMFPFLFLSFVGRDSMSSTFAKRIPKSRFCEERLPKFTNKERLGPIWNCWCKWFFPW